MNSAEGRNERVDFVTTRRDSGNIQIQEKGVSEMKEKGYVGRIQNSGTQNIKAPNGSRPAPKGSTRITGSDLRTGNKSGK